MNKVILHQSRFVTKQVMKNVLKKLFIDCKNKSWKIIVVPSMYET